MYTNAVRIIVGRSDSAYCEEAVELIAVRVLPSESDIDADGITQATRAWLLDGRHSRFVLAERREYADVGAAGAAITYVLTLLASGAAGVAMQEVVNFMKSRIRGVGDDSDQQQQRFRELSLEDARHEAVRDAEHALGIGRGDLDVLELERNTSEIRLRLRRQSNGSLYSVVKHADETLHVRKLGGSAEGG